MTPPAVHASGARAPVRRGQLRWHCRRALLELDLVLERFIERHFEVLEDQQLADLQDLLQCEDHDLWAMVNGSEQCPEERWRKIIALMQQA
ncbi:FAD assembly factor SdhE [Pseudazoarcus pumilus]|uniref:FAD assembly factor SdhE n=1 Tax=Pseudazoarcus pumilus TaxID=2067960 RepID=A0A2I6S789_9RHOO|nr:succinate dehydrogenase assembly factor 2 [Pseudazoarcus pumilus]AUN95130.1 succinate dehydrogenase assembly factor 2 [Pseudazoarcus pumilus]